MLKDILKAEYINQKRETITSAMNIQRQILIDNYECH